MFEVSYMSSDPWAGEVEESTIFEGSWTELQDYIKSLKEVGCYGIYAADICPEWYDEDADLAM